MKKTPIKIMFKDLDSLINVICQHFKINNRLDFLCLFENNCETLSPSGSAILVHHVMLLQNDM